MSAFARPIVTESVRAVFETFGPFLVPVVIFTLGVVGYLFLYAVEQYRSDDWYGSK